MSFPRRAPRILVIDDHVALAEGFARALTLAGYEAHVAHSAEAALREAHACPPDAIILDFQMPFVNGAGFLYRLRERAALQRIPVLVVTGQSLNDEVRTELEDLAARVRLKPIGAADLIAETQSMLHADGGRRTPVQNTAGAGR